ncbi:uncharacterized [Tachysurus ichikawai]
MRSRHEMTEEEECLNGLREVKSKCERAPARSLKRRLPGKKAPIQQTSSRCSLQMCPPPGYSKRVKETGTGKRDSNLIACH